MEPIHDWMTDDRPLWEALGYTSSEQMVSALKDPINLQIITRRAAKYHER